MAEVNARKRGSKWQYYFEGAKVDGKRQRFCKSGFETKKEALAAGTKALLEYNNCGNPVIEKDVSIKDFSEVYLKECQDTLKWSTYNSYKGALEAHIIKKLGIYPMKNITADIAQSFVSEMKGDGLAFSTIKKNKNVAKMMFDFAVRRKVINENPFKDVRLPMNIEVAGNPNISYTDEEIKTFSLLYKGDILETVLMLGYHCGLRLSESLAITWDDIDFEKKTLTVSNQLVHRDGVFWFTLPKYKSIRVIELDNTFLEYIKSLKERKSRYPVQKFYRINFDKSIEPADTQTDTHLVSFVVSKIDGEIVTTKYIHNLLDKYKHEGYKVFRTHCLRHTHCTKLLMNGVSAKYVQQRLGHKNIQTTLNIYTHLTKEKLESETGRLNNLF